jgi:hypothetical protein
MKRPLVAVVLALGVTLSVLTVFLSTSQAAFAQVTGPVPNAPTPGTNQTATLLFNAQLAVSQAATRNAQAAQAAAISYQQAIQRYQVGDITGARTAALQALINAHQGEAVPQPIATIAPIAGTSALVPAPQVIGNVPQIDAEAFVAEARGALSACVNAHDPNTDAAEAQLDAAQRAFRAGKYNDARAAARNAVNLCAAAQRTENTTQPQRQPQR